PSATGTCSTTSAPTRHSACNDRSRSTSKINKHNFHPRKLSQILDAGQPRNRPSNVANASSSKPTTTTRSPSTCSEPNRNASTPNCPPPTAASATSPPILPKPTNSSRSPSTSPSTPETPIGKPPNTSAACSTSSSSTSSSSPPTRSLSKRSWLNMRRMCSEACR